jgi:DNA helicase II / ATP-dependent DNA helicase PcrA
LRAVVNPTDGESLLRIVNEPPRGLGKTSLERIQQFATKNAVTLFEAFEAVESIEGLQKRAQTAVQDFVAIVKRARALNSEGSDTRADDVAKMLIESSGLIKMYEADGSEESLDRWNNIQRVLSHLAEYCERRAGEGEESSLDEYLQEISLLTDADEIKAGGKHVTLMTMHSAKGLEFPVVFIVGMERGLFPGNRAEQSEDEMEEERRLFYVGITRAEERLYLTHAEKRYRFGELTYPVPSPFLGEIRKELLEHGGTSIQSRFSSGSAFQATASAPARAIPSARPTARSFSSSQTAQAPETEHYSQVSPDDGSMGDGVEMRVGSEVQHEIFGRGRIVSHSGVGANAQVTVDFPGVGKKKLVLRFAKLSVV